MSGKRSKQLVAPLRDPVTKAEIRQLRAALAKLNAHTLLSNQPPRVISLRKKPAKDRMVALPAVQSRVTYSNTPRMSSRGRNPVIIHRELIATVLGTIGFGLNSGGPAGLLAVNPFNANLFPWLLPLATSFEKYRFLKMKLCYVPVCSTAFVGRIGLFHDRDSQDPGPFTRQDFASFESSVDSPVWEAVELAVGVSREFKFLNDTSGVERKLYDDGRFGWVTYNCGNNDVDGDIYLEYEVELQTPQPSVGLTNVFYTANGNALVLLNKGGPNFVNNYTFVGTATVATFSYQLAPGTYRYTFQMVGTGFTSYAVTIIGNGVQNGVAYQVINGPLGNHGVVDGLITINDTNTILNVAMNGTALTFTQSQLVLSRSNTLIVNDFS